jgi:uncharacterized protein (DUF2132 family)
VSYLPTGLAGCLVDPGISCGARKLTRIPWVKKKLRNYYIRAFFMKKLKRINLFLFIYDSNEKAK